MVGFACEGREREREGEKKRERQRERQRERALRPESKAQHFKQDRVGGHRAAAHDDFDVRVGHPVLARCRNVLRLVCSQVLKVESFQRFLAHKKQRPP